MEVFVPLLILAVVAVVLAYRNSAHVKAVIDSHEQTLHTAIVALAGRPLAPPVEIAPAVLQHPAVVQGAVTPAVASVLPKEALDLIAGFEDHTAQTAAAQANLPVAAGYKVIPYNGAPPTPAVFQAMDPTTVADQGNGFYVDNTGAVCHFENGVKVLGYATVAPHA